MELASDHHSGVCNFEVALRSFENLCTPDLIAVNDVEGVCCFSLTEILVRA